MPPILPIGSLKGAKPFEAMGTGMPKTRGPQGQDNLGDAGLPRTGGFPQFPAMPQFQMPTMQPPQQDTYEQQVNAMPPEDRPPVDHTKSVGGWLKNLYEDIYAFGAAIPASIKVAAQSGAEIAHNWKYLKDIFVDHPEMMAHELDVTGRQVLKGFTDTYENGLGEAIYKHPFNVLLDATAVLDIAGAGIKGMGKAALKAGVEETAAQNIIRFGRSMQEFPGRVVKSPFIKSAEVLEKIPFTQKIMQATATSELGREAAKMLGTYQLEEKALLEPHAQALFKRRLKKADWAAYDDLLDGMTPRSQIKNPEILERYDEWMKGVMEDERKWADLGIFTPEEMEKAKLKQTALKLKDKGIFQGDVLKYDNGEVVGFTDEAYDAAKKWISGENPYHEATTPVYKQFIHERSFNLDELLDSMGAGERSEKFRQWVSRFEQRTGMKPHILNPDVWQARSMLQKAQLLGTVKFFDESIRKWGKVLKGGIADEGFVVVPPMLRRYVKNGLPNAMDVLLQKSSEAVEAAKAAGKDRGLALHDAIKQSHAELTSKADALMADMEDAMRNPGEYAVQVPREVAYLMQKSMFGPRGMWKFYDNVLNTWRDSILTFMPRYYINNLLGNAVLLMFAGHTPMNKVAALKEGNLPGEALNSALASETGASSSYIGRIAPDLQAPVRRFTSMLSDISDNRAKQVVLSTLSKDVVAREAEVGNTVAAALRLQNTAEEVANTLFQARREVLGTGLEELQATKKAIRDAQGNPDVLRNALQGSKTYQMPARRLDPMAQSSADAITKDMMEIQRKIQRERTLANMNPEMAKGRISELEAQLEMKSKQMEQIDPSISLAKQMGSKVLDMPEVSKIAEIQARRKALQPYADLAEKTILQTEQFFGNYGRLHPIEREYIRRAIPFWTFSKTMFQLAFNLPFLRPKTSFLWNQFSKMMMDAVGDDRLPSRYRNMVPIGGDEAGNIVFMKIGGFNPFENASKRSEVGGIGIPQFIDPRNNPLVKVAVESIGGYDLFTEKPFVKPTDFVSMNGSVKRYDPDLQRIETVIPQKPIIDSLFQQIPHMKILAELLQSAGLSTDYLGVDTPRNPDGTLTYNRQWWHAISRAAGFSISTQNPEKVQMQHALLKKGMVQRFRSAARRVDPETRAQLESILRDMDQAEVFE